MRILITGAARRVGRVIAEVFAAEGHSILIHYRSSQHDAEDLFTSLGGEKAGHHLIQADLDDVTALENLIPALCARHLAPDILINSAAIFPRKPLIQTSLEELHQVFHTNAFAPIVLMRDFAREVKRGVIINILDQRVEGWDPAVGAYGLSKKTLRDATLTFALDWAPAIRVNAIAPGLSLPPPDMPVEKRQAQLDHVPMQTEISPQDIAQSCLYLATASTLTGQILFMDGGLHLKGGLHSQADLP